MQFHLRDEYFEKGTEIISEGEQCKSMMFVVSGKVEILGLDKKGEESHICFLQQGDVIGQYSYLFDEQFNFTVRCSTKVRVLSLSQEILIKNQSTIDGIGKVIKRAENIANQTGVPICDFKQFDSKPTPAKKFRRALARLK